MAKPLSEFTARASACKACRAADARAARLGPAGDAIRERDRQRPSRYNPETYQRNKAHADARNRTWVAAHPERVREIKRESIRRWRRDNPEEAKAATDRSNAVRRAATAAEPKQPRKRKYATAEDKRAAINARRKLTRRGEGGEAERARHRERERERRRTDPDAVRERERDASRRWREIDPEKAREKGRRDAARRNARLRGADVRIVTAEDIARLLVRQRGECLWCGKKDGKKLSIDHIIPLARGGRHAIGNLVLACERCNKSRNHRFVIEWRYRGVRPKR